MPSAAHARRAVSAHCPRDARRRGPAQRDAALARGRPPGDHEARRRGIHPGRSRPCPQHLVDVHDHLRGELAQLRDIVGQVRRGAMSTGAARSVINTMAMRQNNWTLGAYCETYCRLVTGHHTLEDRSIFVHLRGARARPRPGHRPARAGAPRHRRRARAGRRRPRRARRDRRVRPLGQEALDEIQRALDLLTDTLLSHLAYEERELLHPLARHGFG